MPIKSEDGGEYKCIVKNLFGFASHSAVLFIESEYFSDNDSKIVLTLLTPDPPSFVKEPSNVSGVTGQDIRVDCTAKGHPDPTVTWNKIGGQFKRNSFKSIHSPLPSQETGQKTTSGNILHIPSLSRESSGEYECQASNGIEPTAKKTIVISVKGCFSCCISCLNFALFSFFDPLRGLSGVVCISCLWTVFLRQFQ